MNLAARYISDRFLPDKAVDLIDEAGARLRIKRMTAPPEIKLLDEKAAKLRQQKEDAINSQDYEKAAGCVIRSRRSWLRRKKLRRHGAKAATHSAP